MLRLDKTNAVFEYTSLRSLPLKADLAIILEHMLTEYIMDDAWYS